MIQNKTVYRFWFLGTEGAAETSRAIVTTFPQEQILEVESGDDTIERPYIIVGKLKDGVYEGKHYGPKNDHAVIVRWIPTDVMIMGVWTEEEVQHSFVGMQIAPLVDFNGEEEPGDTD